jgi:lipid II:glycine glycyltransferase (peptidoglycan interpeptide bridge formation enzyme)
MRTRKSFDTTVDVNEFARIQETLPESQRMRVLVCESEGVPIAGLVVSRIGNSAIYLLGATGDEGIKAKGAYLLQWTMIQWLKESGVRWYDLGGIDPVGNPGVYSFKKGFSGNDVCQLAPVTASESAVSSFIVKAGYALQRTVRKYKSHRPQTRIIEQSQ